MPQQGIAGKLTDYDWNPRNPDGSYTDLGYATERWDGGFGQMINLGMGIAVERCTFTCRSKFGRRADSVGSDLRLRAFDLVQVKDARRLLDPPDTYGGDVINFNQQYYIGYIGGQFRTRFQNVFLTFQADWGYTWGYNIDHHLIREGDRYTMDNTHGSSWHLAFNAEVPLDEQISLGFQRRPSVRLKPTDRIASSTCPSART